MGAAKQIGSSRAALTTELSLQPICSFLNGCESYRGQMELQGIFDFTSLRSSESENGFVCLLTILYFIF